MEGLQAHLHCSNGLFFALGVYNGRYSIYIRLISIIGAELLHVDF